MLARFLTAKAAAAAAAVLLSAGTAAAANGTLPDAAQAAASGVLAKVGVTVPGSDSQGHSDGHGRSAEHPAGTDAPETTPSSGPNAHAAFGLCTAAHANDGHPDEHADVFPAATCDVDHPGNADGTHGTPTDPGSQGRSHKPSSSSEHPPATTPGDDAEGSDGHEAEAGTDTASQHDGGASATGAAASAAGAGNRGNHGRP
jgi:hypothetical protein